MILKSDRTWKGHFEATGNRGATMVVAIFMVVTVTMLSFSLVTTLKAHRQEERGTREGLQVMYVCEAGVGAALADLQGGGDGNVGTAQNPTPLGTSSYFVTATDLGGGMVSLVATGRDARNESTIQVVVQSESSSLFDWGAFGDTGLTMDSNAMVDSYDSSLGSYASQAVNGNGSDRYASSNGDVGSNGDIGLRSNSWVHGDAVPGPSSSTTLSGNNTGVDGSTLPNSTSVTLPPITLPVYPDLGSMSWTASSGSIGPGEFSYEDFHVDGNATMTIVGPATVVVDNFDLDSNAEIIIDATSGPVEFFVVNDFLVNSNTLIASETWNPGDVTINLLSDNVIDPDVTVDLDDVALDSNAEIYGTIYAPEAHVEIDSNFELFGALVARSVHLDSNSRVHYDEALTSGASGSAGTDYRALCWLLMPGN